MSLVFSLISPCFYLLKNSLLIQELTDSANLALRLLLLWLSSAENHRQDIISPNFYVGTQDPNCPGQAWTTSSLTVGQSPQSLLTDFCLSIRVSYIVDIDSNVCLIGAIMVSGLGGSKATATFLGILSCLCFWKYSWARACFFSAIFFWFNSIVRIVSCSKPEIAPAVNHMTWLWLINHRLRQENDYEFTACVGYTEFHVNLGHSVIFVLQRNGGTGKETK